MRKSILLLALPVAVGVPILLVACAGDDVAAAGHRLIRGFEDRAVPVTCQAVDLGTEAPELLRGASDTSFVVLNAAERRITEYGDDLAALWSLEYEETGPAAIEGPESVTLLADTAVAVLARGGNRLVVLDRAGALIATEALGFIPAAVAATSNGELLITPMPLGDMPGTLMVRYRGGELEELPVPKRSYVDMTVNALGNILLVEALADGGAVAVHQFFAPRAFHVVPHIGGATVSPLRVPTPDVTAAAIDVVPRAPITDDQFDRILTPAVAMSMDRGRDEVYLVTRSGRDLGGQPERTVLRTDRRLELIAAYVPDVSFRKMAFLPRRRAAIVADDFDRFHLCPLNAIDRAD